LAVHNVPTWPKYTVEMPVNMVWNATTVLDRINNHVEADTWREEGMALWGRFPLELDFVPSRNS
jgi:hypothetical protein